MNLILEHGLAAYPKAKRILILCDSGGSKSAQQYLFKEDRQGLPNQLGLELRVAHYLKPNEIGK